MTIIVGLILLGIPVATWIAERYDPSKKEILRMADGDRARQRTAVPQRRMRYATIGKRKSPRRSGNSYQGQSKITINRIARIGGCVK